MPFTPAKCTSCGASIQVPDDRRTASCMYCGTTLVVEEAIRVLGGPDPKNVLRIAFDFLDAENFQEADNQLTRVLEIDPGSSLYWLGKSAVRAFQGNMSQAQTYFRRWSDEEADKAICLRASRWFVAAAHTQIGLPKGKGYPSPTIMLGNNALWMLKTVMELENIKANSEYTAEPAYKGVLYLKDALECLQLAAAVGHGDVDAVGKHLIIITQIYHSIPKNVLSRIDSTEWSAEAQPLRQELVDWVVEASPEFRTRFDSAEASAKASAPSTGICFVASACFGDPTHPCCNELRRYRDTFLCQTATGRAFIAAYYAWLGPSCARLVSHSSLLRWAARTLVIAPIAQLAVARLRRAWPRASLSATNGKKGNRR